MKTKAIGSVFLLFTIVTGIIAMSPVSFADYLHPIHSAFADHHEVTITPVSGSAFMTTFNEAYYSFSPYIADLERESPVFKEIVKAGLTPMISTLSIMESAETESEVLGLGLSVIALNLGMYLAVPAIVIVEIKKRF